MYKVSRFSGFAFLRYKFIVFENDLKCHFSCVLDLAGTRVNDPFYNHEQHETFVLEKSLTIKTKQHKIDTFKL